MTPPKDSQTFDLFGDGGDGVMPWERPASTESDSVDEVLTPDRAPEPAVPEPSAPEPEEAPLEPAPTVDPNDFSGLKEMVHRELLGRLNLSNLDALDRTRAAKEITEVIRRILDREGAPLTQGEMDMVVGQVLDEVFGLGPLEPLLKDASVSEIMVNTHRRVYVERSGKKMLTRVRFKDEKHLRQIVDRIVSGVGRRIDEASPMVDARLPDGSRVNAIIPPLSIDGTHLTIRKFKQDLLGGEQLVEFGSMTPQMLQLLIAISRGGLNVLISGGTGSGKTTLLNVLSSYIPEDERVVTIEDSAELQLRQPHVVRLETRPANIEGEGEVSQRRLVKNALRMTPNRIILGEIRGEEALDMLRAMSTGHDGCFSTLHANDTREALDQLEMMCLYGGLQLPARVVRYQIQNAVHVVVQTNRLQDGTRKITRISEITGMEGETITMQDIFEFRQTGLSADGKVIGEFCATGIRPAFADILESRGIQLPGDLFDNDKPLGGRW